jgi:predicted Zn-dependent protease
MHEDELRLVREAESAGAVFRSKGMLFEDPSLQSYVEEVASRLVPRAGPARPALRIVVLRDPRINAFAMPDGRIYLHVGLLARLENEAQLAHVLAHEMAHVRARHAVARLRSLRSKTVAAKIAGTLLTPAAVAVGGGAAGSLVSTVLSLSHAAAVSGFGRELEEEADRMALERAAEMGYAVEEVPHLFSLLAETKDPGAIERFLYSTHPANEGRARYTRELIESGGLRSSPRGYRGVEAYVRATRGAAMESIRLRLRARHCRLALDEIERAWDRYGESAELNFELGEAHRCIAQDPRAVAREEAFRERREPYESRVRQLEEEAPVELRYAAEAYRRALELDSGLAVAHRGLGLVARERGDRAGTRRELEVYLASGGDLPDRRFIEHVLAEVAD